MDKKRILVADDMEVMRYILRANLKDAGYKVILASNGEEALSMAESEKPDLLILDVMMPKMDGYTVCREVKKNKSAKYIPIIFLTASGEEDNVIKGMKAGADDYVVKPFKFRYLEAKIQKLFESQNPSKKEEKL